MKEEEEVKRKAVAAAEAAVEAAKKPREDNDNHIQNDRSGTVNVLGISTVPILGLKTMETGEQEQQRQQGHLVDPERQQVIESVLGPGRKKSQQVQSSFPTSTGSDATRIRPYQQDVNATAPGALCVDFRPETVSSSFASIGTVGIGLSERASVPPPIAESTVSRTNSAEYNNLSTAQTLPIAQAVLAVSATHVEPMPSTLTHAHNDSLAEGVNEPEQSKSRFAVSPQQQGQFLSRRCGLCYLFTGVCLTILVIAIVVAAIVFIGGDDDGEEISASTLAATTMATTTMAPTVTPSLRPSFRPTVTTTTSSSDDGPAIFCGDAGAGTNPPSYYVHYYSNEGCLDALVRLRTQLGPAFQMECCSCGNNPGSCSFGAAWMTAATLGECQVSVALFNQATGANLGCHSLCVHERYFWSGTIANTQAACWDGLETASLVNVGLVKNCSLTEDDPQVWGCNDSD